MSLFRHSTTLAMMIGASLALTAGHAMAQGVPVIRAPAIVVPPPPPPVNSRSHALRRSGRYTATADFGSTGSRCATCGGATCGSGSCDRSTSGPISTAFR